MIFFTKKNLLFATLACGPLYLIRFTFSNFSTNLLEALIALTILLHIIDKKNWNTNKLLEQKNIPAMIAIGLLLFGTLSSTFSNDAIIVGLGIIKSWFLFPLIFSYILFSNFKNDSDIKKAFLSLYLSISAVSFIAILYRLLHITTYDGRLSAFYASPNYLAMYISPGIFLGIYLLQEAYRNHDSLIKKVSYAFMLLLVSSALFYTYSYAAWFAVFLSLLFAAYFYFSKKQFFIFGAGLLLLISLLVLSQRNSEKMTSLLNVNERSSLSSRIMIWKAANMLTMKNPVTGIGPGNFQKKYLLLQPYFPPYLEWAVPHPHNIFLTFWLESGLLGIIGFILLIGTILLNLGKKIFIRKNSLELLIFTYFLYIIFHGIFDTPFWKNDLSFVFWSYLAIYLYISNYSTSRQKIDTSR